MLRDESLVGWVEENWTLKKKGIGIYHTLIWSKKPPFSKHEKWVQVEMAIKELCPKKDCINRDRICSLCTNRSEYEKKGE